jgi:hypothetical protein
MVHGIPFNLPDSMMIPLLECLQSDASRGWQSRSKGPKHPITKKLGSMHADAQELLQERTGKQ